MRHGLFPKFAEDDWHNIARQDFRKAVDSEHDALNAAHFTLVRTVQECDDAISLISWNEAQDFTHGLQVTGIVFRISFRIIQQFQLYHVRKHGIDFRVWSFILHQMADYRVQKLIIQKAYDLRSHGHIQLPQKQRNDVRCQCLKIGCRLFGIVPLQARPRIGSARIRRLICLNRQAIDLLIPPLVEEIRDDFPRFALSARERTASRTHLGQEIYRNLGQFLLVENRNSLQGRRDLRHCIVIKLFDDWPRFRFPQHGNNHRGFLRTRKVKHA